MRHVKVVPLSRKNLNELIDGLVCTEAEAWPKFLCRAWAIVANELKKPAAARDTVIDAVTAAHACAIAFSARTQSNQRSKARRNVLSAISGILKPIERRAPIRRELDEVAQREFRDSHADLEVIASFFYGCADVAGRFQQVPDAKRMMRALGAPLEKFETADEGSEPRTLNLINHYEAMHPIDRAAVEERLRKLTRGPSASLTVLDVFSAIAHALTVAAITEPKEDGGDLLTAYVADVEKLWRRAGFRPSRVRNASKSKYRGPYHRFLELVLIDQLDPRSRLFDPLSEDELKPARKVHASLPKQLRERSRVGTGYSWLISEHYLKTVKTPIEKTVVKTP
jgi:hypothetical protein